MNRARPTAQTRILSPICATFSKFLPLPARSESCKPYSARLLNSSRSQPPFNDQAALEAEVARRATFIQDCLRSSGLKTLVLGISGGVDSLTAGLLAQRAMRATARQHR